MNENEISNSVEVFSASILFPYYYYYYFFFLQKHEWFHRFRRFRRFRSLLIHSLVLPVVGQLPMCIVHNHLFPISN